MYLFLKTRINKDLNKKYYKKNKFEFIKFDESKINTIRIQKCILIVFFTIISPILYLIKQTRKNSIDENLDKEIKNMQEYIYMAINGTLYNPNEVFNKSDNPKISIVITVYNGEGYLKTALLSIQNQDFKDIEIIMVDDFSKDNSVNLIRELMSKDPRIKLYQNEENKGMLYTKTRGVLHAKGKYVMILDVDDLYTQRDAFSTLYLEAEKNNLDILGFGLLISKIYIKEWKAIMNYKKTDVIDKSNVPNSNYKCNFYNCEREGGLTSCYFFRKDLFVDIIKQIDEKFLNVKMNFHDDRLMFFLLSRKARNLRQIKRIFYLVVQWPNETNNTKIQFRLKQKIKNRENLKCLANIIFIEFLLIKTNNNIIDKNIPSLELKSKFLENQCRFNKMIKERAIKVLELFLRNDYIKQEIKDKVLIFLNETKQNTIKI
jgi:glycosyltransferase involved in cell wall biosynthesis